MSETDPYITRLIEIARAYYIENHTQAEIARSLGISRSLVSRHLTAARKMGIVEIRIIAPEESASIAGQALQQRFPHLKDIIVAPTFSDDSKAVQAMIGRFAANYLTSVLQAGHTLALGCGRTLRAMVEALPNKAVPGVQIVQAMGNLGHEAHKIDYNEIARHAGDALSGKVYYVSAPAILGEGSGLAEELVRANPTLDYALSLARQANVYVVGIGSLESDELYVRSGLIRQSDLDDLKMRAVGDICGRFFDDEGRVQESSFGRRIVGIELDDLRHAAYAIGVAGGADKAVPLLGALRGGFINVVVSDEKTIQHILELDNTKEAAR